MTEATRQAEEEQSDASDEEKKENESSSGSGPQVGTRFSAEEIHDNVSEAAKEELDRPASELVWSALASGLLLGFSFLAVGFLTSLVPPAYHTLATAIAYPLGFVYVVHARHQLFTENTLEPVIPLLEKRDGKTLRKLLRLWAIVLIALMAWLIAATHDTMAQIFLVWLATAPIAAFGFRHSIAGAVEAFYRGAVGDAPWSQMIFSFEIPAILGNVVGGVVLVALLNHGQVSKARET